MIRKVLIGSILCSSLFVLIGCSTKEASSEYSAQDQEVLEKAKNEKVEVPKAINLTDKDMEKFFTSYLTISEGSILILNQKPKIIDEKYWQAYDAYRRKTNYILGSYLSKEAKEKLDRQYVHDDFHYPRFLEINDYMIMGYSVIEEATIISKQIKNDHQIYEVVVTAIANAMDLDSAHKKYVWDNDKGYYDRVFSIKPENLDVIEPDLDQIRVRLKYLVETNFSENFEVNSVKESSGVFLGTDEQAYAKNNSFIERMPYTELVTDKDKEMINVFLDSFMKQDYNFYNYYRKAYNMNYDMHKITLVNDLRLRGVVNLKEDYHSQFNPLIIPIKDDMVSLHFSASEDVIIKAHISSTKDHPSYKVSFIGEAALLGGGIKLYKYTYLFVFEDDMILSVEFINQEETLER